MFTRSTVNHPTNIIAEDNGSYTVNVSGESSITITESRKANTKTARSELSKRVRKPTPTSPADQAKSDADWQRLMDYAASQKKNVSESDILPPSVRSNVKHRISVTYSERKSKEKLNKVIRVPATDKRGSSVYRGEAEELAKKHMRKNGYHVHSIEHLGLTEEVVNEDGIKGKHRSADVRKAISRAMKGHSNFEGKTHTKKSKIAIQIARGHDDRIHGRKWSYDKSTGKTNRTMQLPNDHKWGRGRSTAVRHKRKLSDFGK